MQIYLHQIVSISSNDFTDREQSFMKNNASCDFVIYYKIGKVPLAVIEVDGGYHDDEKQKERDRTKDSILKKAGISILRLKTTDSEIKDKLLSYLQKCLSIQDI